MAPHMCANKHSVTRMVPHICANECNVIYLQCDLFAMWFICNMSRLPYDSFAMWVNLSCDSFAIWVTCNVIHLQSESFAMWVICNVIHLQHESLCHPCDACVIWFISNVIHLCTCTWCHTCDSSVMCFISNVIHLHICTWGHTYNYWARVRETTCTIVWCTVMNLCGSVLQIVAACCSEVRNTFCMIKARRLSRRPILIPKLCLRLLWFFRRTAALSRQIRTFPQLFRFCSDLGNPGIRQIVRDSMLTGRWWEGRILINLCGKDNVRNCDLLQSDSFARVGPS